MGITISHIWPQWTTLLLALSVFLPQPVFSADREIDFNRDIRPILSNHCFRCHGPDPDERQGGTDGFRLDTFEGATADLGGSQAIHPGKPEESGLLERLTTDDDDLRMPPPSSGKKLSDAEVQLLRDWIRQGAKFATHWSFTPPVRPALPTVQLTDWPRNSIDHFLLAKMEQSGLRPGPEADRSTIARRVSLDLTGLPPSPEEVSQFLADTAPDAYERYVDRLLAKPAYGEHWARHWLDLARYGDSAGYADDPERTIWLYRDYVIRSINDNVPFDRFTIEQIAGDLLPNPTDDQRIATAFHRNTLTNNEGGTNDEEFRNIAVVDRVNTTLSVWMGLTMACAQCHTHKYDPITQAEYFSLFAILNNTADADRRDEAPLFSKFTPEQHQQQLRFDEELKELERRLNTPTPDLLAAQQQWEAEFQPPESIWKPLTVKSAISTEGAAVSIDDQQVISVSKGGEGDDYELELAVPAGTLNALQLEVLPDPALPHRGPGHTNGNFVLSSLTATLNTGSKRPLQGRFVRVLLPGKDRLLSLAEVQVFQGDQNLALEGKATQASTSHDGPAELAIDGNTNGSFFESRSVTHTDRGNDLWWEVDLQSEHPIDRLQIWNRSDGEVGSRLSNFDVMILDEQRRPVWKKRIEEAPTPSVELWTSEPVELEFAVASASYSQAGFPADAVLNGTGNAETGWAIAGGSGQAQRLTLLPKESYSVEGDRRLKLTLRQRSKFPHHTIARFRVLAADDPRITTWHQIPQPVIDILATPAAKRSTAQVGQLQAHFLKTTPLLEDLHARQTALRKERDGIKPITVPVCEELPEGKRRITRIQLRGNYLNLGEEVGPGTPEAFHPLRSEFPANRLGLAHWLVDPANPLTARVTVNRYWEQIFGIGLVSTSEDFGSQGELPSHPELLDWLATELVRLNWDTKALLRQLVTSAAYRQSSQVTPERYEEDPHNRLLTRGPRFRLSAEMIRDQALALSGLLSDKMYGPPVKPPQPMSGLSAAFGGAVDWKTSSGEDKFRRGLYTSWRRSNPYPSLATFDAPTREVCTISRVRTNTPLQALVTLNDPVYIEAAQALARLTRNSAGDDTAGQVRFMLTRCLNREPRPEELDRLIRLKESVREHYQDQAAAATAMATVPLGPVPEGVDVTELAALTVVANVVLNLDELLMKP